MENRQYQKFVYLSYVLVAALAAYLFFALGLRLSATFDWETKVREIELYLRLASIGVGAIVYFAFYMNERATTFMNEVVVELSRVTWPTQRETGSNTVVVLIMVLISGLILGALDYLWTLALQWVV